MSMTTRLLLCICCVPVFLAAQGNLKTTVTQRYFNGIRRNLEAAADAMPAARYGFKLTDGQMSFSLNPYLAVGQLEPVSGGGQADRRPDVVRRMDQSLDGTELRRLRRVETRSCAGSRPKSSRAERQSGSQPGVERFVRVLRRGARRNRRSKGAGLASVDVLAVAHRGAQQRDLRKHRRLSAFQRHRAAFHRVANGPKRQAVASPTAGLRGGHFQTAAQHGWGML